MKFCFIVGAGRSGTTLVQSLMDCHPECAVWPFELSFQELWMTAVAKSESIEKSQCLRHLLNAVLLSNGKVQKLGKKMEGSATILDTSGFNKDDFINRLQTNQERIDTPLSYLAHLGESFRKNEKQQVFVMRHNDLPHDWYHENLPTCFHIIMLRDPVENYLAYQRFRIAGRHSFILDLPIGILTQFSLRRVFQSFRAADSMYGLDIPLRLEDVTVSPVDHMNFVANRLEIRKLEEWKPSIVGNPFSGNSTRGESETVKNFTEGYKRILTRNEYASFIKYEKMFTKYYPNAFNTVQVVSEKEAIENLYHERLVDGINKQKTDKWNNLVTRVKSLNYIKQSYQRIHEKEMQALISMDALLPCLVESPSWENIFG